MRSNGAVHIGNDTFLVATRDHADAIFLVTSAFPVKERVSRLNLTRRAGILPNASLFSGLPDIACFKPCETKCLDEKGKELSMNGRISSKMGNKTGSALLPKQKSARNCDKLNAKAPLLRPSNSELNESMQEMRNTLQDDDESFSPRHSLHISPDGHRIVAMSTDRRRHYFIKLGEPADIIPFQTSETVRSVCWHPEQPHLLLLLLVSGVFMVYDTEAPNFRTASRSIYQVDLDPLICAVLQRKPNDSLLMKPSSETSLRVEASEQSLATKVKQITATPRGVSGDVQGPGTALSDVNVSPPKGYAAAVLVDDFGMPAKVFDREATNRLIDKFPPSCSRGLLRDVPAIYRSARSTFQGLLTGSCLISNAKDRPSTSFLSFSNAPATQVVGACSNSELIPCVSTSTHDKPAIAQGVTFAAHSHSAPFKQGLPVKDSVDFEQAEAARTLSTTRTLSPVSHAAVSSKRSTEGAIVVRDSVSCSESLSLELVDICCVQPTRGLPTILLVLASSGDVFSVELDRNGALATGEVVTRDGRLPLNCREAELSRQRANGLSQIPDIHHLLNGDNTHGIQSSHKEALAFTCFRIDEDAGIHALLVCYSSGFIRGVYVDEPDLAARERAHSAGMNPEQKWACFRLNFSSAIDVQTLLSPRTIPTTTHTVQLATVGNICLVRYAENEAFLIAVPVWSRERGGWNYYCPPCRPVERRETEAMRLCLGGLESEVPSPLAVRVPFDVEDASLALGATELMLAPQIEKGDMTCLRERIITIKVANLLHSAMYARSGALHCCYESGMPTVRNKSSLHETAVSSSRAGAAAETCSMDELNGLLNQLANCHRQWLCGFPSDQVDLSTAKLAESTEKFIKKCKQQEQYLAVREAKLGSRVQALSAQVGQSMMCVNRWTNTLLDVIVHRRGPAAIVLGNERLGEIHRMLREYELKKSSSTSYNSQ